MAMSGIPHYQTMTDEHFSQVYEQAWQDYFDLLTDYKNAIADGKEKEVNEIKRTFFYAGGNLKYACKEMAFRKGLGDV